MKIIYSDKCLEYLSSYHPESPNRVKEAYEFLKTKKYEFIEPSPSPYSDLIKVHSKEHVNRIRNAKYLDPDTPVYNNLYEYAALSVGAAILAAKENGFSLMRPPGHHAGIKGRALNASTLGFCYFNNLAVAVKKLNLKTLILDIDGHHGNGTQEIFYKDSKVNYISIHRRGIYPGTGQTSEENCYNFSFNYEIGDEVYLSTLEKILNIVDTDVDLIAVSAGFDSCSGDLASLGLTLEVYRDIGKLIRKLNTRTFAVLEGGYNGKKVGEGVYNLTKGILR